MQTVNSKSNRYYCCGVPQCASTSIKTPEKLFLLLPSDKTIRKKWLQLASRDPDSVSHKTSLYYCGDHFDLEKDVTNYMQVMMGFSKHILVAKGCLPCKFECQADRKRRIPRISSTKYVTKRHKSSPSEKYESNTVTEEFVEVKNEPVSEPESNPAELDIQDGTTTSQFYKDMEPLMDNNYHHHVKPELVLLEDNFELEPEVPTTSHTSGLEYSTPIGTSSKEEPDSIQQMLGEIKETLRSSIDQLEKDQQRDNEFIEKLLNNQERILANTTQQLIDGMKSIFEKNKKYSSSSSSSNDDQRGKKK